MPFDEHVLDVRRSQERRHSLRATEGSLPSRLFLSLAPLLFAAYALLVPPFQTPDENQHLYRAWQLSGLQLTGERRGNRAGGELPASLADATVLEIGSLVPQGKRNVVVRPFSEIFGRNTMADDRRQPIFYNFYGAVIYPPINYVPQTTSIWVGQAAGLSVEWTIRLGRLLNAALCIGLIWWSLNLIPFGRWVMTIIALLPPVAAAAASFGQDGLMIGLGFLLIAVGLKVAVDRRWSRRDFAIAALGGAAITMSKFVYLPIVALAALPRPTNAPWRRWLSAPALIGLVSALTLVVWMRITAHAVVPRFRPWVPPIPEQLSWAAGHPINLLLLIGRTYLVWLPLAWAHLYEFGDSTVPIVWPAAVAGTAALVATLVYGEHRAQDLARGRRAWMLIIFAAISLLIAIAMFLTLAPRGALVIEGIQARYFLPALPLAAIAVMRRGDEAPRSLVAVALAFALFAHASTLETIATTFYRF